MRERSVIRKILRQCVVCRKTEGKHYSAPDPPPLPAFRVSENPPFTYIGVDFTGPLYIKGGIENAESKAWLCLYTCCVTLIRSVKRCLKKVIGRARLTYDELLTIVLETEMIVNSRPLTYMSSEDLYEAITPSHLLIGRRLLSIPNNLCHSDNDDEEFEVNRSILTRRMKYIDHTLTQFWNRWRTEYLLELREAHRYGISGRHGIEIAVGDIVMVHSDERGRGFWNLAKIEKTIIGKDGKIRVAVIRVYTGGRQSKLLSAEIVPTEG
uniref:DUF5641 domain-containing protein n=1 Tax=Amphimedon queenslandica TaxID=400682 RepID=A0A1X7TGA5_AMPQE